MRESIQRTDDSGQRTEDSHADSYAVRQVKGLRSEVQSSRIRFAEAHRFSARGGSALGGQVLRHTVAVCMGIWVFGFLVVLAEATPLDDQLEAYKKAQVQSEAAVANILKTAIQEGRAAEAVSAVKPWLDGNPANAAVTQYYAGLAMQYSGELSGAVTFYRKFLKSKSLDSGLAEAVITATYRLLINDMRDSEAAYLFMREEGSRLRQYGRAKQFDPWFLRMALQRGDFRAAADRLAAVYGNTAEDPSPYAEYMDKLFKQLESFPPLDEPSIEALDNLAKAVAARKPDFAGRVNWIKQASAFGAQARDLFNARKELPAELLVEPVKAAKALTAMMPYDGSLLVAKGWVQLNHGDTPGFLSFARAQRDLKAEPIIEAVKRMPPEEGQRLLSASFSDPRGRDLKVGIFFSPAKARSLVALQPIAYQSIAAPEAEFWSADMTLAEAKAVAPQLVRNPHPHAALVRAYAAAGTNSMSAMVPVMMQSERWRFADSKAVIDLLWHSGLRREGDQGAMVKQYAAQGSKYDQIKKQIAKNGDSGQRLAAFSALYGELMGTNPSTPGLFALWDELFASAPDADRVKLLKQLASDFHSIFMKNRKPRPPAADGAAPQGPTVAEIRDQVERKYLLQRALSNCDFGNTYSRIFFGPDFNESWSRWGKDGVRKAAPDLAKHLGGLLEQEMKSGVLCEPLLGMWLYCVDPKLPEAKSLIESLVKSPVWAKVDKAYLTLAAGNDFFAGIAVPGSPDATDPKFISRELLELSEGATAEQVEAALKAVVTRVSQAREPVAVYGLYKVAALPVLSAATRSLALSLFNQLAPLGDYPGRQGYEQLAVRLVQDMKDQKQWGAIVPYAASLWRSADAADDPWRPKVADAMVDFAEAAAAAGNSSVALSVARIGINSGIAGLRAQGNYSSPATQARRAKLTSISGKTSVALGSVEIPVDETDPAYGIFKSSAEFVQGNLESAWNLYLANSEHIKQQADGDVGKPLIQKMPVGYCFWLLQRNINEGRSNEAETLIKELTIWSRREEGVFSLEQDAELKIAYADLAFMKGALPTARAWYRKVADAREYKGSEIHLRAGLGSVKVDRVSKNFGTALEELDNLMQIKIPSASSRIHYARAEVLVDQEAFKEAADEIDSVLRAAPNHADALILKGRIQYEMRKLVEASEIELGVTREHEVMVPGESLKINLNDPTLSVSGVGADIEVEVWTKSGDRERLLLHQLGDSKDKFRAEVKTALAPPVPGDKVLQVLGVDEIRYGYSREFRAKMKDLPPDPKTVIGIASDAHLSLSAGAFPPRQGERKLDVEELGLSSSQQKLGLRCVRPGNPVYVRVIDPDQSRTAGIDQLAVTLQSSSGDEIRRLMLKETGPYTGEFEGVVPTASAQAMAFASESAPGRDPNMAISSKEYPGWQGELGGKEKSRIFGVDLNDNVAVDKMSLRWISPNDALTHFVLQTSMNGLEWTTRARYPEDPAPWDGSPLVTSISTEEKGGGYPVSSPKGFDLPADWAEMMELISARARCDYKAARVSGFSADAFRAQGASPWFSRLYRFRAMFYQSEMATRRFQVTGFEPERIIFLIDGKPAESASGSGARVADGARLMIERELQPGMHEIQVWCQWRPNEMGKAKVALLCDAAGQDALQPCPVGMFDPKTFPEGVQALMPQPATIAGVQGGLDIGFGDKTQARLVRLVIQGFEGVAPSVKSMTLTDRDAKQVLPVKEDFMSLRQNGQLEVLPGDQIVARYEDEVTATPKRNRHEQSLSVAYNTGAITASFLNYETTAQGRQLKLEPIRRFNLDDAVAIVIDDVDMDGTAGKDVVDFVISTSAGVKFKSKAVETEEHSGRFIGRIFPVLGKPARDSEIQMPEGGTLTMTYRDMENLDPGIPADRVVTIEHAKYSEPALGAYTVSSELLPPPKAAKEAEGKPAQTAGKRAAGPEVVLPRRSLSYNYVEAQSVGSVPLKAVIGGSVLFDVLAPHLALAYSSEISAYVQTEAGRRMAQNRAGAVQPFDVTVPGTLKLAGRLTGGGGGAVPQGYVSGASVGPVSGKRAIDEGRFSFSVPLMLGDIQNRSFATSEAEALPRSSIPEGLAVKAGDVVYIGFAFKDEKDQVQWRTASVTVGSHAFLDVMKDGYNEPLTSAFVGEKVFVRVLAPGLDMGPERDSTSVALRAGSGAAAGFQLRETESHSGIFKGVFSISYADAVVPSNLPPVELNGLPVRYGDDVVVTYAASGEDPLQSATVKVNMGADGTIEPFSKRFTGDEMAVKTGFTLAECLFELAKKHKEMNEESLARREMQQGQKLLAEAVAMYRDDEMRAHAEYLLGNLSQEYGDLAKNDEAKIPMYQDALARFSKIPVDYPDTEFAPKAQFKTALVYEKMGETEIAVEEYVKLAYKYPDCEYIPEVMSRLGGYFQGKGQVYKEQADPLREKTDVDSQAEVLRLDELSYPEFLRAATIFGKLQSRFPDHELAGLAGLRAAQNFMRAHQYDKAISGFKIVMENEAYDGLDIRAQAIYWCGLSYERAVGAMSESNYNGRGMSMQEAYQTYRRVTFDFPDSKWAKYARGRLADPAFAIIIEKEELARERMLDILKYQKKNRQINKK